MALKIANRREDPRQRIPRGIALRIAFTAGGGSPIDLPLDDISVSGASFTIPHRLEGVEAGAMLGNATIRLGQLEIRVHLQVQHTTRAYGSNYNCGVRLFPVTENDRNELIGVVTRLASLSGH